MHASDAPRLLCLMQLPPPAHGVTAVNQQILARTLPACGWSFRSIRLTVTRDRADARGRLLGKILAALEIVRHIWRELRGYRPQVVYLTPAVAGLPLIRDWLIARLCARGSAALLLHLHGTDLALAAGLRRALLRDMLSCGRVITLAGALVDDVQAVVGHAVVDVLPNAVPDREFRAKPMVRPVLRVLYLANLNRRKGVATAIRAYAMGVDAGHALELTVAGGHTHAWTPDEREALLATLSPGSRAGLHFAGPADECAKAALFQAADVFLYPTAHDAFPLVVLEAMSWGLAVIASGQGALPEMLADGAGCVVDGFEPAGYAQALGVLAGDRLLRERMSAAAVRRQRERYSLPVFDAGFRRLLQQTLTRNRPEIA